MFFFSFVFSTGLIYIICLIGRHGRDRKIEKSKDMKDEVHRRGEIIQRSKENNGTENTT
jgi:hypothetical protein